MKQPLRPLFLGVLAAAITSGCVLSARARPVGVYYAADSEVYVTQPMPPPRVEVVTVAPSSDMLWVNGYWGWSGGAYAWNAGRWQRPSHPGYVWVAPRYQARGGRHVYVQGRWSAPRVVVRGQARGNVNVHVRSQPHGRPPAPPAVRGHIR